MGDKFIFIAYIIWGVKRGQVWWFKVWHFDNTTLWALGTYAHRYKTHNWFII